MLRYWDYALTFAEIPDEISVCVDVTGCPFRCEGCHSPWLRKDIGQELTEDAVAEMLKRHPDATCVCLMGGDSDHGAVAELADRIHEAFGLKTAMYSGSDSYDAGLAEHLDYYKVGAWKAEFGPLTDRRTNQRLYKMEGGKPTDITYEFWRKWDVDSLAGNI